MFRGDWYFIPSTKITATTIDYVSVYQDNGSNDRLRLAPLLLSLVAFEGFQQQMIAVQLTCSIWSSDACC